MSAQVALRAHLNALLDNAAKDRAEEAPEAWANLEKIVRLVFCIPVTLHFISWGFAYQPCTRRASVNRNLYHTFIDKLDLMCC